MDYPGESRDSETERDQEITRSYQVSVVRRTLRIDTTTTTGCTLVTICGKEVKAPKDGDPEKEVTKVDGVTSLEDQCRTRGTIHSPQEKVERMITEASLLQVEDRLRICKPIGGMGNRYRGRGNKINCG